MHNKILCVALAFVLLIVLSNCNGVKEPLFGAPSPSPTQSAEPEETPAATAEPSPEPTTPETEDPEVGGERPPLSNREDPIATVAVGVADEEDDEEEIEAPNLPEREPMDDEFFADAAFLGNSLIDGFRLFSGLTTCDFYATTSMTVMGVDSLLSQMAEEQYKKVYILLGINEIGYDSEYFKSAYSEMLVKIKEQQPEATIYIMGLTPVGEYKSNTDSVFSMDRVRIYNEKLHELAEEYESFYVDLCDALADENGYLPAEGTSDGIHLNPSRYVIWLDYLRTHYA